ncbi:MAG: hypothetical protein ACKVP7_09100 [Hyphomicrobiaceae bacterium]
MRMLSIVAAAAAVTLPFAAQPGATGLTPNPTDTVARNCSINQCLNRCDNRGSRPRCRMSCNFCDKP